MCADDSSSRLLLVQEIVKERAIAIGRPDLAEAIDALWADAETNPRILYLINAVHHGIATSPEFEEFVTCVKAIKKRLRREKKQAHQHSGPEGQAEPPHASKPANHQSDGTEDETLQLVNLVVRAKL